MTRAILGPTRQDTWFVGVHLNGNSLGVWDKKTGGEVDSDDNKYYPGGMADAIALGGHGTTGNVTLQRIYDRFDDHEIIAYLFEQAGKGIVTVTQRPLDPDGVGYGKRITYHGILKRVQPPEVDSESTTAALIEIEVTIKGRPSLS